MVSFRLSAATSLLFLSVASAHFILLWPSGTEGQNPDEDKMPTSPCGGTPPTSSTSAVSGFEVNGDSVAMTLLHPQATWLFRGKLGSDVSSNLSEWTELLPFVQQTGEGNFCEPALAVPSSWSGQKGTISVVVDSPDGVLYQCAVVNFVSGTNSSATCTNGTSVTGTYESSDTKLATILPNASGSPSASDSPSPSATGKSSAADFGTSSNPGLLASLFAVVSMMLLGYVIV
jgi:hypothetical protein